MNKIKQGLTDRFYIRALRGERYDFSEKKKNSRNVYFLGKVYIYFFVLCICQKSMQLTEIKKTWGKSKF